MEFFRDVLSGVWYYLYLILCILVIFYILGIVADRKRLQISKKLKEKKTYDIESGKEAQIAAMESKQVLSVGATENNNEEVKKQEEPMVLSSEDTTQNSNTQPVNNVSIQVQPQVVNNTQNDVSSSNQNQAVEPLVLNSNE